MVTAHASLLRKKALPLMRRSEAEATTMMAKIAHEMRPRIEAAIPNPKKLPYVQLVGPYRDTILEDLMSGLDPQDVFDNVLIDMRNDQLGQSEHEG
jgi:hypothetical protein